MYSNAGMENPSEKDSNQGTLEVSKLDFAVTNDEFRSAEAALRALNMSQLAGKLDLRHPDGMLFSLDCYVKVTSKSTLLALFENSTPFLKEINRELQSKGKGRDWKWNIEEF
ncbi:hypothetical protein AgCh_029418 [Apium graveolens]